MVTIIMKWSNWKSMFFDKNTYRCGPFCQWAAQNQVRIQDFSKWGGGLRFHKYDYFARFFKFPLLRCLGVGITTFPFLLHKTLDRRTELQGKYKKRLLKEMISIKKKSGKGSFYKWKIGERMVKLSFRVKIWKVNKKTYRRDGLTDGQKREG